MNKNTPSKILYQLLYNRRKLKSDVLKRLKLLKLQDSEWYAECDRYYNNFDVRDKIVVDIGADFGTSPLYFLAKGAKYVVGFSLEKQYFYHPKYMHIVGIDYYPEDSLKMWEIETGNDPLKTIDIDLEIQPEVPISDMVLKCDAEGWEWNLSAGFIDSMHDWIIALHCPILNPFLFEWIKKNGLLVAQPIAFPTKNGDEFAIYRKRLQ